MKIFKNIVLGIVAVLIVIILSRVAYCFWFMGRAEVELRKVTTGLVKTDSWTDEYYIGNCSTATDGTSYSFFSCDTNKIDSSTYNPYCGCYQWEKKIGKSWYTVSICPEQKEAHCIRYFYSILDMLCE